MDDELDVDELPEHVVPGMLFVLEDSKTTGIRDSYLCGLVLARPPNEPWTSALSETVFFNDDENSTFMMRFDFRHANANANASGVLKELT